MLTLRILSTFEGEFFPAGIDAVLETGSSDDCEYLIYEQMMCERTEKKEIHLYKTRTVKEINPIGTALSHIYSVLRLLAFLDRRRLGLARQKLLQTVGGPSARLDHSGDQQE
jgi:hypothetical protein